MKKLVYIFIIMVTMLACSEPHERTATLERAVAAMRNNPDSALRILDSLKENEQEFGRHFRMQCRLHRMNALNKLDTLFHSTEEAQRLADHFDRKGTSNEQMLAHYLLGRAYCDMGESPMALKCFQNAVAKADTTAKDCDYGQLSRVYGQMGNIFLQQNLLQHDLECTDIETKYAWKAKDTLNALLSIASKVNIYNMMSMSDSAIIISERVSSLFKKYGYKHQAASILGSIIENLTEQGQTMKAKQYIDIYETESGFFDSRRNIEKGREIYYYTKGQYYLAINKYDSAEYYFRKELCDGKDFNNQNAASRGLALLFQKTNSPDSAAKYSLYSYVMNDSCYRKSTTNRIIEIQAMYDYTRNQEVAQIEKDNASSARQKMLISLLFLVIASAVAVHFRIAAKKEKKEKEQNNQRNITELAKIQMELIKTQSSENEYKGMIESMKQKIDVLNKEIKEYNKNTQSDKKTAKERMMLSEDYQNLQTFIVKGQTLVDKDIENCHKMAIKYFPHFYEYISSQRFSLNRNEFNTCVLIRLYVKPNSICNLLNISASYVSKMRSDMLYRLFGVIGKPKEFDEKLQNID